jgi:hypothetical protein
LIVWFAISSALAAPCPDLPVLIDGAWSAFDDAELDGADDLLDQGYAGLACQPALVPADVLLDLYRLDGLVALAQEDREAAIYATMRAVSADPTSAPPTDFGPQLAELHASWAQRLAGTSVQVRVVDGGAAWVDGRAVSVAQPLSILGGEHLFQWRGEDGFVSEVRDVSSDQIITTGVALLLPPIELPPVVAEVEPEVADDEPREQKDKRRHRGGLIFLGTTLGLAGGGGLAYGYLQEVAFALEPYDAEGYGECPVTSACYEDERALTIRHDAGRVRMFYGIGYGLVGLGSTLLGAELFLLPAPSAASTPRLRPPGGVGVRVPW